MKKQVFIWAFALSMTVPAAVVRFAKTSLVVRESAAYAELTVTKKGPEATRVRFATVSGTAIPGRDYYATNGVLSWAARKTNAQKIRVRLMPDVVETFESNKVFSVALHVLPQDGLEADEQVAEVSTPSARVEIAEAGKARPGTISLVGYYDADDVWRAFQDPRKPSMTMFKNGDGGLAALSFVRTGGGDGAIQLTVKAVQGTAKLGTDYTLGDDLDIPLSNQTVEWADGDVGEKRIWLSAYDDEGDVCDYERKLTLKFSSRRDAQHVQARVATSSMTVFIRDANVAESLVAFNARLKATGVQLKADAGAWYLSSDGTVLCTRPNVEKKTKTFSVSCTGPGFFTTFGSIDEGEGDFVWKMGKTEGRVDGDMAFVLPSGVNTINFKYTSASPEAAKEESVSICGSSEEDMPFSWVSFANVVPMPSDKAVCPITEMTALAWGVPERAQEFEGEDELHYRVRLAETKAGLDKSPLFTTNVCTSEVRLPNGLLEAGKSYVWRVDYLYGEDSSDALQVAPGRTVWTFATAEDTTPRVTGNTVRDIYGVEVTNGVVALRQGVRVDWTLGLSGVAAPKLSVRSGKLPKGLKLAQNAKTKAWTLTGVPTVPGTFRAVIGGMSGKTVCTTYDLTFTVKEMALAAGTYTALVVDEANLTEAPSRRMAFVTLTTTAAGKLSAKVAVGGKTYSFATTGWDACEKMEAETDEDVTSDELDDQVSVRMTNVQRIGGLARTNELEIVLRDAAADNLDALAKSIGSVTARLFVPSVDGKTVSEDAEGRGVPFVGNLYRDNSKNATVSTALANFAGYYTVALVPQTPDSPDAPTGNGYLTVSVDAKGLAKVAGRLADGTAISAKAQGYLEGLLADWAGEKTYRLNLPLHSATVTRLFGGNLALEWTEENAAGVALVDSDGEFTWCNDSSVAMYDTEADEWSGFDLTLAPVGGWYDTVSNLQAYYRRVALAVDDDGEGNAIPVELVGNKVVIDKASGITLTFNRATGLLTGTVSLIDDFTGTRMRANHAGVLLSSYQQDTLEGVWSAGYRLFSRRIGKKRVNVSRPFCISREDIDPDFVAGDEGDGMYEEIAVEE